MSLALGFLLTVAGCAKTGSDTTSHSQFIEREARVVQQRGLMSSNDWITFSRLGETVATDKRLNDHDFGQLLELMKAHQDRVRYVPSQSVIATHMTAMNLFRRMNRASPDQKRQMVSTVSPLLRSPDKYERTVANQIVTKYTGYGH